MDIHVVDDISIEGLVPENVPAEIIEELIHENLNYTFQLSKFAGLIEKNQARIAELEALAAWGPEAVS